MLHRLSPEEFDERYAAWLVEWEDRWEQTGTICATVFNALCLSRGVAPSWTAEHFMPATFAGKQIRTEQTAEDLKALFQRNSR